jgi:hypothetical protein
MCTCLTKVEVTFSCLLFCCLTHSLYNAYIFLLHELLHCLVENVMSSLFIDYVIIWCGSVTYGVNL